MNDTNIKVYFNMVMCVNCSVACLHVNTSEATDIQSEMTIVRVCEYYKREQESSNYTTYFLPFITCCDLYCGAAYLRLLNEFVTCVCVCVCSQFHRSLSG